MIVFIASHWQLPKSEMNQGPGLDGFEIAGGAWDTNWAKNSTAVYNKYGTTFYSLFTPYGYKFEGKAGELIYEQYSGTGVRWTTKEPWKFGVFGYVNMGKLNDLENVTEYWASVSMTDDYRAFDLWINNGGRLYSSDRGNRFWGSPVRCRSEV